MAIRESALNAINSIATSDFVRAVTSAGASSKVTVANLAKSIIENYSGSTLAGSAQSVKSAVDANKSAIDAVQQVQNDTLLHSYTTTYSGTKTIAANGYVKLGNLPSDYFIMSLMVVSWGSSTGAFGLALASGNAVYLVGQPNVNVTDISIRALYH